VILYMIKEFSGLSARSDEVVTLALQEAIIAKSQRSSPTRLRPHTHGLCSNIAAKRRAINDDSRASKKLMLSPIGAS